MVRGIIASPLDVLRKAERRVKRRSKYAKIREEAKGTPDELKIKIKTTLQELGEEILDGEYIVH